MKKVLGIAMSAAVVLSIAVSGLAAATTGPLNCPDGQNATHIGGDWSCTSNGSSNETNGSGRHKGTGAKP